MIRVANNKDLNSIYELGLLASSNFKNTYDIKNYLNDNNYIILLNDDPVTNGLLIIYKNIDCYELLIIAVHPQFRKMGIANSLLDYFVKKYLRINDEILLEVSKNNMAAINLYKKHGFKEINIRKGYYTGIDAIVMKKVV